MSTYQVPGTMLSTLHMNSFDPHINPLIRLLLLFPCSRRKLRHKGLRKVAKPGFKQEQFDTRIHADNHLSTHYTFSTISLWASIKLTFSP